jgi:hypothetical protein
MSRTCSVIICGFVFIGAVVLLEFFLRGARNSEDKRWKWDRYDTLTFVLATVVAVIAIVLVLSKQDRSKQQILKLLSDVQWPQMTPRSDMQDLSPEPLLKNAALLGYNTPEGYLSSLSPNDFTVSSFPSNVFNTSSQMGSTITPLAATPPRSKPVFMASSSGLSTSMHSSGIVSPHVYSSGLVNPLVSSSRLVSPPVLSSGVMTPPQYEQLIRQGHPQMLSSPVVDFSNFF